MSCLRGSAPRNVPSNTHCKTNDHMTSQFHLLCAWDKNSIRRLAPLRTHTHICHIISSNCSLTLLRHHRAFPNRTPRTTEDEFTTFLHVVIYRQCSNDWRLFGYTTRFYSSVESCPSSTLSARRVPFPHHRPRLPPPPRAFPSAKSVRFSVGQRGYYGGYTWCC